MNGMRMVPVVSAEPVAHDWSIYTGMQTDLEAAQAAKAQAAAEKTAGLFGRLPMPLIIGAVVVAAVVLSRRGRR